MPNLVEQISQLVTDVARPSGQNFIPLHEPVFLGNEKKYVSECIDSGWVSSVGGFVNQFEDDLAKYCGVKKAVVVINGTAALHMSLLLAEVKRGDEVLLPTITFVATANTVSYCGAIPHFIDSCEQNLGIDVVKLRKYLEENTEKRHERLFNIHTNNPITAIVPMHVFGHPVKIDGLMSLAEEYGLVVIEDAAESLGSYYNDLHTGNFGMMAAMSFNGNKTMTTGGGGAILTNDEKLAKRAKHLTTTAKVSHQWNLHHDEIGYNYRMPNLNAALGVAQLELLPQILEKKRALAFKYEEAFQHMNEVRFLHEEANCRSNYWLNTLILKKGKEELLDEILKSTNKNGIMTRPLWDLMHRLPMYTHCPKMDLSCAESLRKRVLNVPSGYMVAKNY